MEAFKIHTVAEDGKPLSHDRLFQAWVQLAGNLAKMLPDGPCRQLCEAVYEAVTRDEGDDVSSAEQKC